MRYALLEMCLVEGHPMTKLEIKEFHVMLKHTLLGLIGNTVKIEREGLCWCFEEPYTV